MKKTLIIIAEAFADRPLAELDGRTPLQAARTPGLDRIASSGAAGAWRPAPRDAHPGLDATLQALLGVEPPVSRGVLEAQGLGVELREGEAAFRANFVCMRPGANSVVLMDPTGCGLSDEEGARLVDYLNEHLAAEPGEELRLLPLGAHRALLTYRREGGGPDPAALAGFPPPDEIVGVPLTEYLPTSEEARRFVHLINDSQMILSSHPGLRAQAQHVMFAANSLWLWGGGTNAAALPLADRAGGRPVALVSASLLAAGLARLGGAELVRPEGGGAEEARRALTRCDLVVLAPGRQEEAPAWRDAEEKIAAIERFDEEVAGPLVQNPGASCRICVVCDNPFSVESQRRLDDPAPYAAADWEAGRLAPPPPGGLAGLWRRLAGGGREEVAAAFSELLCETRPVEEAEALRRRLLA